MTYISEDFFGTSGAERIMAYLPPGDAMSGQQSLDGRNGWMQLEGTKQPSEKAVGNWFRSLNLQDILWQAEFSTAMKVGMLIWLTGILGFTVYSAISVRKWKSSLRSVKREFKKGNIRVFRTGKVTIPFVTGLFRPRIYLPEDMEWHEQSYVLLHERVHIRRGDHVWRILAYAALCLHWFNPLVWAAFFLSERDMEMSCDEAVIRKFGSHIKKEYSTSLLTMSAGSRGSHGLSPAFAEGDIGRRIRNVLRYKKPTVILVSVAVVVSALAAVFLMSNPINASQDGQIEDIEIYYHADDGEFTWGTFWETTSWEDNVPKEKSAAEDEPRTVITLAFVSNAVAENESNMLTDIAVQFNKENEKYFVEMRTCRYGDELGSMRDQLLMEVGAGGGPDLLTSDVFPLTQEIMDSGVLVDLAPYLEASGITPEKYFPAYAAAVSGDRIYGVCPDFSARGFAIDPEVLGDREPPEDVEALVDMLLEYQGHGSFRGTSILGRYILAWFLKGSEDLWGMIDWEENTCDFTGPLFSKILDVAKRYREDGKKGYEPVVDDCYLDIQTTPSMSISKYCPGFVPIGFYFDDGPHYYNQVNGTTLMINGNTEHLEGAYAFVSYALSKKGQDFSNQPVHKEMWDSQYQYYLDLLEKVPDHPYIPPLNEETRQETLEAYEDARFVPRRAEAILEIVYEEAEGYIEGDKNKEDVINMIQNRVQLYLDEQR